MELNAEDLSNLRKLFQMRTLNETVGMAAIRPAQAESLMKMAAAGLVTYRTVNYEEEKQKARVERLKLSYEQRQQAEALELLGEMSLKSLSITIPENYNLYFITAEGAARWNTPRMKNWRRAMKSRTLEELRSTRGSRALAMSNTTRWINATNRR